MRLVVVDADEGHIPRLGERLRRGDTHEKAAQASGPAPARLEKWLRTMFSIKHKRLGDDPEMFATYLTLAREACKSVNCHKDCLVDQIALILSDGVKEGASRAVAFAR